MARSSSAMRADWDGQLAAKPVVGAEQPVPEAVAAVLFLHRHLVHLVDRGRQRFEHFDGLGGRAFQLPMRSASAAKALDAPSASGIEGGGEGVVIGVDAGEAVVHLARDPV